MDIGIRSRLTTGFAVVSVGALVMTPVVAGQVAQAAHPGRTAGGDVDRRGAAAAGTAPVDATHDARYRSSSWYRCIH